ncbi:MAG TPA: putative Ig domain-containing protein [Bacillota bacterium]|nr:putative Ig domain-containing protein [Bacillota bacterium]
MPKAVRRGFGLILGLVLVLGPSAAQAASAAFTDLANVPWAVPGITALQQQGVLLGVAPGLFAPTEPVSRAQMAAVLGRLLGWQASASATTSTFSDAASIPAYARPYVVTAAQDGIIQGLPGGLFAPDVNVTWAQLAVMAARAYTYPQVLGNQIPALVSQLAAGTSTPAWAVEAVAQDVQAGDFSGVLGDLYQADQPVTRAELAAFLLQVEQSKGTAGTPVSGSVAAGQVTAVTSTTLTLGNQSIPIAPNAGVYVGSAPSNLSAVQVGDTVSVVLSGGQAILINVTSTPNSSSATTLAGTLTSVSSAALGLSVPGQTTVTLPVDASVTVTLNGATSALTALAAGEQATVTLDASGNIASVVATGSGTTAQSMTGTVASISSNQIVLTTGSAYSLASGFTVNGIAGNLGAAPAGTTVTLTITGGAVTAIQTGTATLSATTTSLPGATMGSAYTATLAASGGTGVYTWTATGTLPPGLALTSTGTLTGTPTTAGSYGVPVEVQDTGGATATATLSLTVSAVSGSLTITTTSLPPATEYQSYSVALQAAGGSGTYTWSYSGTLPVGLALSSAGMLSGTPDTTGTFSFAPVVADSVGHTATVALSLTVGAPGSAATLAITPSALPTGTVGQTYSTTLQATGGTGAYSWTYSGGMPPGLTLSMGGQLAGTPTTAGNYTVGVQVTDSSDNIARATFTVGVSGGNTASTGPLTITTSSLPAAALNQAYATTLTATGGAGGYNWTYSGNLCPGMSLSQSGVLGGTPTATGTFTITVLVRDQYNTSASQSMTLVVGAAGTTTTSGNLTVTTTQLPGASTGVAYTAVLAASGGGGNYTWTYTGTMAPGLILTTGGMITGTPTTNGTYTISPIVRDAYGNSATAQLTLTVGTGGSSGALSIATTYLPAATYGVSYTQAMVASGGSGSYTWTYSGSLPTGLTLGTNGLLTGTPTAIGTYTFTAIVRDTYGNTASTSFTLAVGTTSGGGTSSVTVTTTALPSATQGSYYSATIYASGGSGNYTWTYTGSLPPGLSLSSNGAITGTPSASGSFVVSVQALDATAGAVSAARQLVLTVVP